MAKPTSEDEQRSMEAFAATLEKAAVLRETLNDDLSIHASQWINQGHLQKAEQTLAEEVDKRNKKRAQDAIKTLQSLGYTVQPPAKTPVPKAPAPPSPTGRPRTGAL